MKLVVDSLNITYQTRKGPLIAIEELSLEIREGEFLCILGPSGCGKSTLLYTIAGLLKPTSGNILLDGRKVTEPGAERAMVFQQDAVFPWLTVADNIAYGLKLKDIPKSEREKITEQYINFVGLSDAASLYPRELSGGMRKRVDLARAFANNPAVLLLDEPFGSLDAMTKEVLQLAVLKLWTETKKTICFVTHDIEEALFLSQRTLIMTHRPARIKKIIKVPFAFPREKILKTLPEFQNLRREFMELLEVKESELEE